MNKKIFLAISSIAFFTSVLFSQEPVSETKKVIKGDDDKLYINKSLPVYIWISSSPDENSKKVRLRSESSSEYTNPMFFDTEGYNTIRSPWCVDTITKKTVYPERDIIFEVYADGLPPVSTSIFKAESKAVSGNKRLYGRNLTIELKASDQISGVGNIYYSLDGSAFKPYTEVISVDKEGNHVLKYYATDKVGNIEELNKVDFAMDYTPPVSTYEIDGLLNNNFVSPDATIKLSSKDSTSGVKHIYYQVNNNPVKIYTVPVPVRLLGSSDGTITFYAVDNAGNKEADKIIGGASDKFNLKGEEGEGDNSVMFEFYVDKDPPTVSLEMKGDSYQGDKYMYVSSRTLFEIIADDDKSGVDKSYYSVNSESIDNEYKQPFEIDEEGLKVIRVKATDFVGNVSPVRSYTYFVDKEAPSSHLIIGSPKVNLRDTIYISKNTMLSLKSTDKSSGIKEVMVGINDGAKAPYEKSFNLENSGINTIKFGAVDQVDNKEDFQTQKIFVDNEPPEIYYHFSINPIGSKEVRGEEYTIYPTSAELYLAATDIHAGGETISYSVNGGDLKPYISIKNLAPGNYSVQVVATDIMKNKSTKEIKFAVEK